MKTIGIWMDKEKAFVITINKNKEDFATVFSEIEDYHVHGGSGTRFKGGPQDVIQDSTYLEREKHQFRAYFKKIIPLIEDADKIVIFGPAGSGNKFKKELSEHHKKIDKKVEGVFKSDSLTNNQTKALIRNYFKNDNYHFNYATT